MNLDNVLFIASDHAGYDLKQKIVNRYIAWDLGTFSNTSCDYPVYADILVDNMKGNASSRGILICGSGIGMSIAANRYNWIRGALCYSKEIAELARKHNDANVLILGARFTEEHVAYEIVDAFLTTEFEYGRHSKRVDMIS